MLAASDTEDLVIFSGNTPNPATTESLPEGTLADLGITAEALDAWVIQSNAAITWDADGLPDIHPPGSYSVSYRFYDYSTRTYHTGETINISEQYGVGDGVLQVITGSATGSFSAPFGVGAGVLQPITGLAYGGFNTSDFYGGATGTLEAVVGVAQGSFGPTGTGDGALSPITGIAVGISTTSVLGNASGVLSPITGAAIGVAPLNHQVRDDHTLIIRSEDHELRII